ncbi:hypothetical protein CYLTODRAFT_421033 [Cylindrobasidium torrendii FP15055 ss-10]|uniref:F-box domain-containing protein n=1 Tax=Cylindrobasidium torrendii FP15055 ss-10 TaxID=1314674 RepID=A0A0D7BHH1_9AGAR|nr:hypothetical protein CYLTODRAFT_421033 [Cylindrobasidium torrendii FP15055 ss-10]
MALATLSPAHRQHHGGPGSPSSAYAPNKFTHLTPNVSAARPETFLSHTPSSTKSRQLPPLPAAMESRTSTTAVNAPPRVTDHTTLPPTSGRPSTTTLARNQTAAYMRPSSSRGLNAASHQPRSLSCLLSFLPWKDFMSLAQTCKSMQDLVNNRTLKDVILSRYVESYGASLRLRSKQTDADTDIQVTLQDIDLFLISQHTPLHFYPTRALVSLTAAQPSTSKPNREEYKLARLTQAHSRMVLLLQSLVHSAPCPPPTEAVPEIDPFTLASEIAQPSEYSLKKNGSVRELTFPAPLSHKPEPILNDGGEIPPPVPAKSSPKSSRRSPSVSSHQQPASPSKTPPSAFPKPRSSVTGSPSKLVSRSKSRLSIFNGKPVAPPPPSEPKSLTAYSTNWRRSLAHASISHNSRRRARGTAHPASASEGCGSDDDLGFTRPHRQFASESFNISDSSFTSLSGSASTGATTPPLLFAQDRGKSPSPPPPVNAFSSSPHGIDMAMSRVRAPILRVYVPCSDLTEVPDFLDASYLESMGGSMSIQRCEEQLTESGLWAHLSTGDIVCNLGYVPPALGEETGSDEQVSRIRRQSRSAQQEVRKWLIFNGSFLVPFCPPEDLLPLDDPITLPSPFYYDHIVSSGTNVRLTLQQLPTPHRGHAPVTQLVHSVINVPSPHSRGGMASVKRWAWTARAKAAGISSGMGIGWEGEWVFEGDGTIEGRQYLLDCIAGHVPGPHNCELVRDRSGRGRVWLRLLDGVGSRRASPITSPHL